MFVRRRFAIIKRINLPSLGGVASTGRDGRHGASARGDGVGSRAGGLAAGVGSRARGVGGRLASGDRSGTGGVGDCNSNGC